MDNDKKIIKILKRAYKSIRFKIDYRGINVLTGNDGNKLIKDAIKKSDKFMAARCGATEMRCVGEYLSTGVFSERIRKEIHELSGVFPTTDDVLKKFCEYYMDCAARADLLALWSVGAEKEVVKNKCGKNTKYCKLATLEPYYFEQPWSEALRGKKVLVVHPFVKSIQCQYENRDKLFADKNVLPQFQSLICVKAVQSIAGGKTEFNDWFEALESMKEQIAQADFDIAIIGAGAYSLPLAAYVKELGKISIQMSGATQILFGIKGKRWEDKPAIAKHFNSYWIRPSAEETPPKIEKVEGGSYW